MNMFCLCPFNFLHLTKFWVFLLTTTFEPCQDNVVFGTCGKDTAPTQVSRQIQNEVLSKSLHCLLTVLFAHYVEEAYMHVSA